MERYKNMGGNSGITAYEIDDDSISVYFSNGSAYLYTNRSAGINKIERMKALALAGEGLNSYIMKYVNKDYESILR